jgi:hypothetical protein
VSKVFKNIAVFSLWIAGLVIIAHLLIPHDHHSDCSVFNNDNECHAQNTAHHDKSPAFPMHCHALNDLTFEKASNTFLIYSDIPTCDLFILNRFDSCLPDSDLSSSGDLRHWFKRTFSKRGFPELFLSSLLFLLSLLSLLFLLFLL